MRRVVITGLGALTPFGEGVDLVWNSLIAGKSAITKITKFDVAEYTSQIAGQVIFGKEKGQFDPDKVMEAKEQRRVDDFVLFALAAADEAVKDANWVPQDETEKNRTGVIIGSGIGGLNTIHTTSCA